MTWWQWTLVAWPPATVPLGFLLACAIHRSPR